MLCCMNMFQFGNKAFTNLDDAISTQRPLPSIFWMFLGGMVTLRDHEAFLLLFLEVELPLDIYASGDGLSDRFDLMNWMTSFLRVNSVPLSL